MPRQFWRIVLETYEMASQSVPDVIFDIVGHSKLNIYEQSDRLETLKATVREPDQFKKGQAKSGETQ
jgi:hypothetical protein